MMELLSNYVLMALDCFVAVTKGLFDGAFAE